MMHERTRPIRCVRRLLFFAILAAISAPGLLADPVTWNLQMSVSGGDPGCPMPPVFGQVTIDPEAYVLTQLDVSGTGCRVDYTSYDPVTGKPFSAYYSVASRAFASSLFPSGGLPASLVSESASSVTETFHITDYYGPDMRVEVVTPLDPADLLSTPSLIILTLQATEIGVWGKDQGIIFETPLSGREEAVPVPEPWTLALAGTGMLVLLGLRAKRFWRARPPHTQYHQLPGSMKVRKTLDSTSSS